MESDNKKTYIIKDRNKDKFFIKDNCYGEYLLFDEETPFDLRKDGLFVSTISNMIKKRIMDSFTSKPTRIENEETIFRLPLYDDEIDHRISGSIGWKAELYWGEKS